MTQTTTPAREHVDAGGSARVQLTAPERIYLTVSDDYWDESQPFPADHEGVCWSVDSPVAVCVPYVRADLLTARPVGVDDSIRNRRHAVSVPA